MKIIHTEIFEIKDFEEFKKLNFIKRKKKEKEFTAEDFKLLYEDDMVTNGITGYSETWEKMEESEEE